MVADDAPVEATDALDGLDGIPELEAEDEPLLLSAPALLLLSFSRDCWKYCIDLRDSSILTSQERWVSGFEVTDCIALNPARIFSSLMMRCRMSRTFSSTEDVEDWWLSSAGSVGPLLLVMLSSFTTVM